MSKKKLLPCILVFALVSLSVGCRRRDAGAELGRKRVPPESPAQPTPLPSAIPSPTLPPPQCPLVPEAGFGDVWRNEQVWPRLGCAVAPAEGVTGTEVYLCGGTHLLWLREQSLFVVIPARPYAWAFVPDESDLAPEMPLMEEPVPRPELCFQVTGRHSWVVELLSSGTTPGPSARTAETAFSGVIQRFEEGWLLWNGNVCFVLFADGTWTMF